MLDIVKDAGALPDLESYLGRASANELARRSLLGAPVYTIISLIMLTGTPLLIKYGWWSAVEALLLIMLGGVRIWFALGFKDRYDRIGEKAVLQFSILTVLQSLTLGVLTAMVIVQHWAAQEIIMTVVLLAGFIAARTSALSVRRSAHFIFLACVLVPVGLAVFMVGGLAKAALIVGFLLLMAFLVQDGGQARHDYAKRLKEHYEEQLNQRRIAIEFQAKREFIKDISHQIRSPVNSIIGMTALLMDEKLSPRAREIAKKIKQSSGTLLNLVGNIPGPVQTVHAIPDVQMGGTDLHDCVENVVRLFKPAASTRGLDLTLRQEGIPDKVSSCDEENLTQVLVNLLTNAIENTEKGSVKLAMSYQQLDNGEADILFEISDTGIGIPPESLPGLFDPFSDRGACASGEIAGTGIGLPTCKGLVDLMGGDIWVESTVDQGTTVYFTIRVELGVADSSWQTAERTMQTAETALESDEESYELSHENFAQQHPHQILVVDDDDIHRLILCTLLKNHGYKADEARDGEEAVAAALQGCYDLIFMDLRMPNMDGIESSKWIHERFKGVRIVALTGDNSSETRARCIRAGMDNFITKPVNEEELEALLCYPVQNARGALHLVR